ncbi:hypothetical protein TraAM80_08228 [Trypanosoma rangeli]|uniref:Uncharacterized protein n=1 Tax=Trypanosoma rangeli TaxID=5698 RepID=A0A3R7RBW9_TRYRA|nr:uncharacterized protein TraAM80_08228 [Trypanosoma rangeli]RNE99436.1 hypothetical protein TraAM80_08228 [Trypanosoma rangeli]|eukprot:RNE99436.1 hypothetical protein TraAM80_08228 [Trypanosoma rangeli]
MPRPFLRPRAGRLKKATGPSKIGLPVGSPGLGGSTATPVFQENGTRPPPAPPLSVVTAALCAVGGWWRRVSQFTAAGPGALPKSAPKSTPTQNGAPEIPQWNLTRRVWAFSMLDRLGGAHEFKEARVPLLGGGRAIRHHSRRGERGSQRAANTASA